MYKDFGYIEEGNLGKPYNLKLLKRLFPFVRPYIKWGILSVALILLITAVTLLLPYLTKIAIDRYIVVSARKININSIPDSLKPFVMFDNKGNAFILSSHLKRINPKIVFKLEQKGELTKIRYYPGTFFKNETKVVIKKYPSLFSISKKHFFISYEDLKSLPPKDILLLRKADIVGLFKVGGIFLISLIIGMVATYWQIHFMELTGQNIMHDIRMKLFSHLVTRSISFFDKNPIGRLVTRVTNDIENLHEMFTAILINLFKDIFLLLGILLLLINIHFKMAIICLTLVPIVFIVALLFSHMARDAFRITREKIAQINATIQESIAGIRLIQIFLRERENIKRFYKLNHENFLANLRQVKIFAFFVPIIELLLTFSIALIIWYGGKSVVQEEMSLGTLVAFISYMRMFFKPIQDISEKYNIMQSAMASVERIFKLLDEKDMIPSPSKGFIKNKLKGEIEFKNVYFGYNKNEPVLNGVTFKVYPKEMVALFGPTGAGKSSIISLLFRFYDVWDGEVLIDGIDVRKWDLKALRSRIALVMQDLFLFSGNLKENLLLGKNVPENKIKEALFLSNANRFIDKLPSRCEEKIGEGGQSLSYGERQLIALARALIHNPDILILDEATSNVDPETDFLIQDGIKKLKDLDKQTSIIIAHRISTIRLVERILVLNGGRIVEEGKFSELLAKKGLFYQLYQMHAISVD